MQCEICGNEAFVPGYKGRTTFGLDPVCGECGSTERHRIVFGLLEQVKDRFRNWRALQFAPDCSVDRSWFSEYTGSVYGGENSLNMMETGLETGDYNLVLANHVLEHVPDDVGALKELLRVVGPEGLVVLTVPAPVFRFRTDDWGYPDPDNVDHYREYGSDFPNTMSGAVSGAHILDVIGRDTVTGLHDHVYVVANSEAAIVELAKTWQSNAVPMVYLHRP